MELNYKITPEITSPTSFLLHEEEWTDPVGNLFHQYKTAIIETREKAIREGLIALGWVPPPETNNQ